MTTKHKKPLFFFLFLLITRSSLLFGQSGAMGHPLFFESRIDTSVEIHQYSSILVDPSKAMGIQDVLDALNEQTLLPADEVPDFGKFKQGRYAYWQYFEIQTSPAFEAQLIYFRPVSVRDSTLLFQFKGNQLVQRIDNGYMIERSYAKFPFKTSDRYATPLVLEPGQHYRFLVRLTNTPGHRNNFKAYLYPKNYDFTAQRKPAISAFLLYGGFFAVLLFMALFSLMQYIQSRDKSYLFYALYLIAILCFNLRSFGFKNPVFEITPPFLANYWYYFVFQIFIYLNYILFTACFLETKTRMPRLHRFIKFFLISLGLLFIIDRSLHQIDMFWAWQFNVWARFVINMICIIFLLLLLKTRDQLALFIIVGSVLLIFSLLTTQFISFDLGRTPGFLDLSDVPAIFGTLLEIFCFALGLGYKSRMMEADKIKAENKLLIKAKEAHHLQELDELKTHFYTNITHEFRTPLTIIQGLAGQIQENPDRKLFQNTTLIRRNSQKLLQLVNQMLDLSKLEAGKSKLEYAQSDMIRYLAYLVESFHSLANDRQISISFHAETEELLMDYDPEKCRQVVDNLVTNAIKFTPEYGQVKVVAKILSKKDDQPWLEVSFQDTGLGIPADKIPLIFDRFYQIDHSGFGAGEGTGLGLALTKELIELMDGNIQVESEMGQGSKFTFRLPIRRQAGWVAVEPPQPNNPPFSSVNTFPGTVDLHSPISPADAPVLLIIEDNTDVTYYLRGLLENQYQIISCRNGRAGVEKALEIIPDLIISDVMMPELDGFALCQQLKTDERSSHIPIILLTAKAAASDRLTGLSHGADAYLTKPFDEAELLIRLERLHSIRQQLQQKYSTPLRVSSNEYEKNVHPEDRFIQKLEAIVLDHLEDENFSIHDLAGALHLSRSQANRKVKALTGFSLALYLRQIRLEKGKLLLKAGLNVSEAAYRVGFKSAVYFSQTFKDTFGESPTDWLSRNS